MGWDADFWGESGETGMGTVRPPDSSATTGNSVEPAAGALAGDFVGPFPQPGVLSGQIVVFTGTLASMTHREAMDLVQQHGGRAMFTVTSHATLLVIGEEGWAVEDDGRASQKLEQALRFAAEGRQIRVVAESDWLQMLGLEERREDIRRACTPAMLSRLLNVPVRLIRRWERQGLIRPVRRVCRLPYFDYREVAGARRLAALLAEGVSPKTLESSLLRLSRELGQSDRSLAQLNLLVQDERILVRDERGVMIPRTGQRLLDFDAADRPRLASPDGADASGSAVPPVTSSGSAANVASGEGQAEAAPWLLPFSSAGKAAPTNSTSDSAVAERRMADWNADEWFEEGCRLTEESEFDSAVNSFRNSLALVGAEMASLLRGHSPSGLPASAFPDPADVNFHLADALYRRGDIDAAIERYHCAVESAPDFIEAWTQLGCLQTEIDDTAGAEVSFSTALSIHPANPDALLHYAQLLDHLGHRESDALSCWRQYLQHDRRGPWSDHARDRIAALEQQQSALEDVADDMVDGDDGWDD
jgi:tetratricopeptide (TPR) repeat protein